MMLIGCAISLDGRANSITEVGPSGAMSNGRPVMSAS